MTNKSQIHKYSQKPGTFLPAILMIATILIIFSTALLTMVMANLKRANLYSRNITATNIAEAGINYYLWHLEHNTADWTDGHPGDTVGPDGYFGPYTHPYSDNSGTEIGSFDLYIYQPNTANATITVKSVGKVTGTNIQKTVSANLGQSSFANFFLFTSQDYMYIGPAENIHGPVHQNNPLQWLWNAGTAEKASSTCATPPSGRPACIYTTGSGSFTNGFTNPVDAYPLANIDYSALKTESLKTGNTHYDEYNGGYGYHVILHDTTYDIKYVKKVYNDNVISPSQGTISVPDRIQTENNYLSGIPYPDNGLIYVEDNVYIEGNINNKRVTVVAAKPSASNQNQYKSIYIMNNLCYGTQPTCDSKNSQTKLGLISQFSIMMSRDVPNTMELDAAMITKNDYIFYAPSPAIRRTTLNMYGSIAHKGGTLFWNGSTGYPTKNYYHDTDLIFNPPPYYPKNGKYQILNWHEE